MSEPHGGRRTTLVIVALASAYCALQLLYITRLPLVMDEFDGAYEAFRLRRDLPYRDFVPYKTVLGYYFQTAATFFADSVWGRIIALKAQLVIFNAAMLAGAGLYLSRFLSRSGTALALLLLICCSTFLERSSELRVDMLTAWAGLWSLLFLLRGRHAAAGLAAGVSFLVSQKGAFFLIAGALALGAHWLVVERTREAFRKALLFGAAATAAILVYVIGWGSAASFRTVFDATFIGAANAALMKGYEPIRSLYWGQILRRDPALFLLELFVLWRLARNRQVLLLVYTVAVIAQCVAYSQPWPYFFVLLLPTLFVSQAAALDVRSFSRPLMIALIGTAVVFPLLRVFVVLQRSAAYQRYNVELAEAILGPRDTYLAGIDMVHDREQAVPEMARLGATVRDDIAARPESHPHLAAVFEARRPKLVIANARIYGLPRALREYILRDYVRLAASVWVYAPAVHNGEVDVAFEGRYRTDARTAAVVKVDGVAHRAGTFLTLRAGTHRVVADGDVVLRLMPEGIEAVLDPRFVDEQDLYPQIYTY